MANTIKLRRSATAGAIPTTAQLALGELALNTYDGKLYTKKDDGTASIIEIGAGAGSGGITYTISSTAPSSPSSGDMWFDLDDAIQYTYINDGSSSQWVETGRAGSTGVSSFSAGSTGLTPSTSTTGAVTLAGTLAVANGGTGVTTSTGTGSTVLSTSPTLVTPLLGTPTSGTLTNCTGYTFSNLASKPTTLSGFGITDGVSTADTGTVTSTMIADGTIVNGDISVSASIADTKLATISTAGKVSNSATTATDANTASAIVARDASGNFSAGTITAALSGNASSATTASSCSGNSATATSLATARTISLGGDVSGSASFNGTADITITATVADDSHNHIISNVDGLQTALDAKAPLASPALTGTPTAPTAAAGTNTTQIATTAFVGTAVANIVDAAPAALNTLNELAAALGDDANFSTTVTNSIATKLPLSGGQMTGNITFSGSQTVDGRDLSVDGAKLDGIESGATADQTASEILTAIKTVDGSGSGLDADLLDGINGASFLRSDAADSASGVIDFLGGSSTTPAVRIRSGGSSWSEGLAVHPSANNGYALAFFRTSATLTTSTNTWAIGNLAENGTNNFGLVRRGLTGGSAIRADSIFDVTQAGIFRFGFTPTVGSNTVWHAGNDGSGSGLDADTLDGIQASSFARTNISQTFTGAQIGSISTLTDAATISMNASLANNFTVTLGGNRTFGNPSNMTAGQVGSIFINQDGTGNRTLSWASYWKFPGGTAPTLSTSASAQDRVDYIIKSSTEIHAQFSGDFS